MRAPNFAGFLVSFCMAVLASCASEPRTVAAVVGHVEDHELSRRVEAALSTATDTKDFDLGADAFRGVVMLTGYVESTAIRAKAGQIAAAVAGVTEVRNSIEIRVDSRRKESLSAGTRQTSPSDR